MNMKVCGITNNYEKRCLRKKKGSSSESPSDALNDPSFPG